MKHNWFHPPIFTYFLVLLAICWTFFASTSTVVLAQQPTETPVAGSGMFITVITDEPQINVRLGPSSSIYPIVGTLLRGATAPALGRSAGGDWVQIEYPGAPNNKGWVYSPLVQVSTGVLLLVEPPPTPPQPPTATIDPTLAAQFPAIPTTTRLPTFTPPPALAVTVYTQAPSASSSDSVPLGIVIVALAILGVIGFLLSVFIRR